MTKRYPRPAVGAVLLVTALVPACGPNPAGPDAVRRPSVLTVTSDTAYDVLFVEDGFRVEIPFVLGGEVLHSNAFGLRGR